MDSQYPREAGFSHILATLLVALVLGVIGFAGWRVLSSNDNNVGTAGKDKPTSSNRADTTTETAQKQPDSAATIDNPEKITTEDGKQHFYYGAPAGQNNASPKKILITMHGTSGSAENDYAIWKPYITETPFALASLNWWDGVGDTTPDYTSPEAVNTQIHDFLSSQGYTKDDVIVLEGFSRGSANSYPIAAFDRASSSPLIDVVVSSSGGTESTYFDSTTKSIAAKAKSKIFTGIYWIMSCGGKDPNPTRDGCEAMETSKAFVTNKGASVLGILSDPKGGHGALTTSSLNLPKQMFELIEQKF